MALSRHEKLARGIKDIFDAIDIDYQKSIALAHPFQLYFYESCWMDDHSPIKKQAFNTMVNTHRCSLKLFSSNKKLQAAAQSSRLIGVLMPIELRKKRQQQHNHSVASNNKKWPSISRWNVRIVLPSEFLEVFKKEQLTKFLYCHSKGETSLSTNWFEKEDLANTFMNQFFTFKAYYQEKALFQKNLNQLVFENFQMAGIEYYEKIKFSKFFKTLLKIGLAPKTDNTNAEAYELVLKFSRSRKRKDFDDFKGFWRDRLEGLIFANLKWTKKQKETALKERFSPNQTSKKKIHIGRWETGQSIDRQMYASFICYFAEIFLENPREKRAEGEIVLLLWTMICLSLNPDRRVTIKCLLKLTTADVFHGTLSLENQKNLLPSGLANLVAAYSGGIKSNRQQKFFPNLTPYNLKDHFHLASIKLLPVENIPILPEAFLTFPHNEEDTRISSQTRQQQQKHAPKILYSPLLEPK